MKKITKLVNEIRNYITKFGMNGVLEFDMRWAYWDDNDDYRDVDDAYWAHFSEVKLDGESILVKIDRRYHKPTELPFEEDNEEILESVIDELFDEYGELDTTFRIRIIRGIIELPTEIDKEFQNINDAYLTMASFVHSFDGKKDVGCAIYCVGTLEDTGDYSNSTI